jgi:hypothetical protein
LALSACADATTELHVPTPDVQSFELSVYPVLLRDCGFSECHGNPERFFHVYGPGRTRAKPKAELSLNAPATSEELTTTYRRARSMLAYEGSALEHAALLRKPLDGGHEGRDEWGNNVYQSVNDPGYQVLLKWALAASRAPFASGANFADSGASSGDAGTR